MSEDILTLPPPPADSRISYGHDPSQFGDLRLPAGPGPFPLAIAIHGGYWRARYDLEYLGHACAALTAAGVATWSVEYRRVGMLGGGWPGTLLDVARAADSVTQLERDYPLDLSRVVAVGHSAGGHLACWLAARPHIPNSSPLFSPDPLPLSGVVALAGVLDLRRAWELRLSNNATGALLCGSPHEWPERYAAASPIELLPLHMPQTLVHGTADTNVPFELSERYAAATSASGGDARLIALPGTDHFDIVDPRAPQWRSVLDAVSALLS
jgi:acetyl esterase/lipase